MPCKQDIKQAILDSVFSELTENRYTFNRIANDTIQVNGKVDNTKSKAGHQAQAMAIAKELVKRTEQSYNGHVKGEITQHSQYDPITVKFTPSKQYIEHEYNKLPLSQKTDKEDTASLERSHILTDTGHNTYEQLYLFAPTVASVGAYVKLATFKENQLSAQRNKLRQNNAEQRAKNVTDAQLLKLKREERDLKLEIEGDYVKGIKGLVQEIEQLKAEADTSAVAYYVQKDLNRLDKLAQSEDLDDLKEAQRIVEFYNAAGTFTVGKDNPFFLPEEMFLDNGLSVNDPNYKLTSDLKLPDSVMQQYRDWAAKARQSENVIEDKRRRILVDEVNKDYGVKNTYKGKQFTFEELVNADKGLKDTDWFSMWTMDITTGVWSDNGKLPQVMYAKLLNSMEEKEAWSRDISKKIDEISPKVQEELAKLDGGIYTLRGIGILGLKGASYQVYKEVSKDGNETGGLIQRFTPEYNDAEDKTESVFWSKFNKARELSDPLARSQAIDKAFEDAKRWRRNNSVIIDISKLNAIANDPQLAEFQATGDATYEAELTKLLGKKGFDEQVEEQRKLLRRYQIERQAYEEGILMDEGKNPGDVLSTKGQAALSYWESNHHPTRAVEDYKSITGVMYGNRKANNFMDFNVFAARKYKPTITANMGTGEYDFTDTTDETGHYSENFAKIEGNPTLSSFYDMAKEVSEKIRDSVPYDIQQSMKAYTLPGLAKVSAELVSDKNLTKLGSLSLAFRHLMDRIRASFGVVKQSEVSYASKDPITGEENYKVNESFLNSNSRAIHERETIESTNFLQLFNTGAKSTKLSKITKTSNINLSTMNANSILELTKYLHIDVPFDDIKAGRLNTIKSKLEGIVSAKTGNIVDYNVPIGKLINDYSTHTVVQSQTFDLPKLTKYFSNMTMAYAARQEALPLLEVMKHYYEGIKRPATNNLSMPRFNAKEKEWSKQGLRASGISQMEDYFKRVVLNNYGGTHFGQFGSDTALKGVANNKIDGQIAKLEGEKANLNPQDTKYKDKVEEINAKIDRLEANKIVPTIGKTIYSKEERDKLGEIQRLLSKEKYGDMTIEDLMKEKGKLEGQRIPGFTDATLEEEIAQASKILELKKIQQGLGKTRTASALIEGMLAWTRTLKLGYNVASATTNFLEGVTSNVILGADGSYFDSKEIFYAYGIIRDSLALKSVSFGKKETNAGKKNRILADKFKVVIDSTDELQKSSHQSISSKLNILNPHDLNRRVEFINQTPIMIAMLRTLKIKDKNGNESSVWDAYETDGTLKADFKTPHNVENWENLEGEDYANFKQKLNKAIGIGHGLGYDEMRGMMAKSSTAGKAVMMFKTWIPSALYWRFAQTHDDLQVGKEGYKGRYRSHTKVSAALHGAIVGLAAGGPVTALALGAVGFAWGTFAGTQSNVNGIKETIEVTKQLFKKAIGMPVNLIVGKEVIGQGNKAFNNWQNGKFNAQDAMNMRANMSDLAIQLMWLALILFTKAMLWDDDDDPNSLKRKMHNLFANKFAQLGSQAAMYVSPVDTYKNTLGSLATLEYLKDLGKELTAFEKATQGKDIIEAGSNAGQSRVFNQTKKILMPGLFKSLTTGGFENEMSREFNPSPYQHLFTSKEKIDKEISQGHRASRKRELEDQISIDSIVKQLDDSGYQFDTKEEKEKAAKQIKDKQIKSILNTEIPTPAQLKKYGVTRDEYEEYLKQQNQ